LRVIPAELDISRAREMAMNGVRAYTVRMSAPVRFGVSFGSALAMVISYSHNHSILWAIIHGILSWLYVVYAVLFGP
jgi:hypothetical protein